MKIYSGKAGRRRMHRDRAAGHFGTARDIEHVQPVDERAAFVGLYVDVESSGCGIDHGRSGDPVFRGHDRGIALRLTWARAGNRGDTPARIDEAIVPQVTAWGQGVECVDAVVRSEEHTS